MFQFKEMCTVMSVCLSTRPVIILTFWLVALHLSGDREIVLGQMTSGEEKEQMTTQYFRTTLSSALDQTLPPHILLCQFEVRHIGA